MIIIYLTSGTTSWVVPSDWDNSNNTIETIGGGGGGQTDTSASARCVGGGGGAYSKISNLTLTAGNSITVSIGAGGAANTDGGDTYFNGANLAGSSVGSKGGKAGNAGGAGGVASSGIGTTKFSGGTAGTNTSTSTFEGGTGGGGAGGPNGDGKASGTVTGTFAHGGSGGGAGSGGSVGSNGAANTGGNGGAGFDSTAGGTGGASAGAAGGNGSHGSGGGGGAVDNGGITQKGGNGGNGIEFDSTHGAGGGGGGGGDEANGGNGGLYGGGGGGNGGGAGVGGTGGNGLIVITYTPLADNLSLNTSISNVTSTATVQVNPLYFVLNTTVAPITLNGTLVEVNNLRLNQSIGNITSTASFIHSPLDFSLYSTLQITPYLRIVPTPYAVVSFDPWHDPYWVAVECDLFDDITPITIRMGNRGVIKRTVSGVLQQYEPRLKQIPIELGTTINVTSYGSPVRGQPNGGIISFAIDESMWSWFGYRWIGQRFRVYAGQSVNPVEADVDEDLTLVYVGRIASLKYDTSIATIQTTDETIQWDNPLVTDFYDNTFPKAIQEKPKPYLWGYGFGLEPILEDEGSQRYGVSHRTGGLDFISEVRVGGIPWNLNVSGPPGQGQWTPNLAAGTFDLGSPPLGADVRCDAQQGSFTVAGIIRSIIEAAGGVVDDDSMAALDVAMPMKVSYATTDTPVNRLDAIDDFVTNAGCWWSDGPVGKVVAGVIDVPDDIGTLLLDETNIMSISLNTIHPPAWRIRVGYQRNWSPESSFFPSVLQVEQRRWSEASQVFSPKYENNTIRTVEPRAVDVPLLLGTFVSGNDAHIVQQRLVKAWGTVRSLYDVTVFMKPEDIVLYDTVAINYMMVTGNFRITSAIRAIGGGGPATLQVWGTLGPFAVEAPPNLLPSPGPGPGGVADVGIWVRRSGSGTFTVGTDCPSTVTHLFVRGIGGGGGGAGGIVSGGFFFGGGGGGAGGYFEDIVTVTAGSAIGWSVGQGGSGMGYGSFGVAGNGGDTSFGGATGFGGLGGDVLSNTVDGGAGGGASGATVIVQGGLGGVGYHVANPPTVDVFTANGAGSVFGGGKHAATTLETAVAAPGSGGGGHVSTFSASSSGGEAGMIIVIWFSE